MMEAREFLSQTDLGSSQTFMNMVMFPLFSERLAAGPEYVTLKEALSAGVLTVTEVSEGGSVPNLSVENRGRIAVLLLDGEELSGAKQNRILNTTILVPAGAKLTVPVSCTEHGRWSYVAKDFGESGNIMERSGRGMNMREVHANLAVSKEYRADQGQVWERVAHLADDAGVRPSTGAMRDVFESRRDSLEDYIKNFRLVDGQRGMLVLLAGRAVGFDYVSRPGAFAGLFPKLLKSYAMEALLAAERAARAKAGKGGGKDERKSEAKDGVKGEGKGDFAGGGPEHGGAAGSGDGASGDVEAAAHDFLAAAGRCGGTRHESVGLGWYYRFSDNGLVGSALFVGDGPENSTVIHTAFFAVDGAEQAGPMAGMSHRRSYRVR